MTATTATINAPSRPPGTLRRLWEIIAPQSGLLSLSLGLLLVRTHLLMDYLLFHKQYLLCNLLYHL